LESFQQRGLVDADIIASLACVAASGAVDAIVQEAREKPSSEPLPEEDKTFLESLCKANS